MEHMYSTSVNNGVNTQPLTNHGSENELRFIHKLRGARFLWYINMLTAMEYKVLLSILQPGYSITSLAFSAAVKSILHSL